MAGGNVFLQFSSLSENTSEPSLSYFNLSKAFRICSSTWVKDEWYLRHLYVVQTDGAAANQQPLLIVYKHNTVRPAAFKSPRSIVLTTADQTTATGFVSNQNSTICTMNPIKGRESVCRSLFGPVDQEQLRRDLKQRLKEITEQDSRRWNFNFQADAPLPGRFQWEEVPADRAAALYQEPAEKMDTVCPTHPERGDRLSDREESADTDQENRSSVSNTRKRPAEVTPVRRKRAHSRPAAKPRSRNARITDFFAKRRRTTETKSALNPFHTSSSEAAQCKTIR